MAKEQACTYDSYTAQNAGANRTAGWKFTPTENIVVSAIRIKGSANYTTKAQIWKQSDGTLIASTDITLVNGSWVEQSITPVTLTAGIVYVISQNVYTTYGYYGVSDAPASSYYSSKISNISDVRIDSQNTMPTTATGWYLALDFIIGEDDTYKTSGNAVFAVNGVSGTVTASSINWAESKPNGTTLTVSVSTDGTNYSAVTKGNALLAAGTVLNNATIYVKVEMATTDATVTPTLSNLAISLQSAEDRYSIVLEMEPLQRFESAAGNITVAYAGGSLMGEGGPVAAFTQSFSPSDLAYKGDQNDAEHIEMNVSATGTLTRVYYTNTAPQDTGHIEMSVTATGTLTNVNDI